MRADLGAALTTRFPTAKSDEGTEPAPEAILRLHNRVDASRPA